MAQILDKQGLQHYANKMCNADNRKVGSKNLPTALNEIDIAIDGFKTLFETEYGTPVNMELENNENVFSVGTGTNIDKKDDVENSFTDLKISGNTLVNLMPKITSGDYIQLNATTNWVTSSYHSTGKRLKPNTKYTVILDVHANSLSSTNNFHVNIDHKNAMAFTEKWTVNSLGRHVKLFTTKAELLDNMLAPRTQIETAEEGKYVRYSIILLEGDWTNKPLPQYFEGLKSIGEKEDGNHKISISSTGKNLCPYNNAEFQANETRPWVDMLGVEGIYGGSNVANRTRTWFYLSEGKYKLSYKTENCIIQVINKNENLIDLSKNFKGGYVCIRIKSNTTSGTYSVKDLQIELSETQTHYEPYKENKKEISLNEPLRGLPNGVRDTIEKINGEWKIVRRCIQIDLNGTEYWTHENPSQEDGVNTVLFSSSKLLNAKDFPQLCDRFIPKNANLMLSFHPDSEGIGCWSAKDNVNIRINKNRLSTVDSAGFKAWLSQNPTRVLFELATPIIEDISPITLQCWKNGVISIDDVLPVETNHTVALNKSAQIKNNIKELTTLRKRVEDLESFYDKIALEQAYQLDLVNHSYELDYNR